MRYVIIKVIHHDFVEAIELALGKSSSITMILAYLPWYQIYAKLIMEGAEWIHNPILCMFGSAFREVKIDSWGCKIYYNIFGCFLTELILLYNWFYLNLEFVAFDSTIDVYT